MLYGFINKLLSLLASVPYLLAAGSADGRYRDYGGPKFFSLANLFNADEARLAAAVATAAVIFIAIFKGWWLDTRKLGKNKAKNGRPARSVSNELGSGNLAKKDVILAWCEPEDKDDTMLTVKDLQGSEGIAVKDGKLIIPREERNRHMLILSKTGGGKTTKMILPVLYSDCLNKSRSTIIIDSKPEMWDKLAGLTRKYNPEKKIILFNPLDTARSLSWNIIGKVETDTDAKLIANTVIMATDNPNSKSDSPFFRNNALQVLNAIMGGLLEDKDETLSMPRVHELVHSGMQALCDWLEAHPAAIRNSRTFVELARSGSQNADTIMSELGMRLAAWDLKAIRATTSVNEFDIECIIEEPTLFIVEFRESEVEMLRPMANVIVVELLRFLTKRAETFPKQTLPRPVGLVIDEFASAIGRLPDIHVKLNTLRSRNVSIVAAIQSIAQIRACYDKDADSVLSGFSTKIFMPPLDFQDSEWASKETGTMTVRFNVISKGRNKRLIDYFAHRNDNMQEQVQQRAVLTPDEIGRPADDRVTFFLPNTQPFQGHLIPYWKVPDINKRFLEGAKENYLPRDVPLHYVETMPQPVYKNAEGQQGGAARPSGGGAAGGIGSIFNLTPDQVHEALENVKPVIGFDEAEPLAKEWWMNFEKANASNMAAVLSFAHELRKRFVKINEFYTIYATTGLTDVPQILAAIDSHIYAEYKKMLGWEGGIREDAKTWWIAFEEANESNFPVVVELARELIKRGVNIENFFDAYVDSKANNIPAILAYLDDMVKSGRVQAASASIFGSASASVDPSAVARSVAETATDKPPTPPSQPPMTSSGGGTVIDSFVSSTNSEGNNYSGGGAYPGNYSDAHNFRRFDEMLEHTGSNYSLVFNSATTSSNNVAPNESRQPEPTHYEPNYHEPQNDNAAPYESQNGDSAPYELQNGDERRGESLFARRGDEEGNEQSYDEHPIDPVDEQINNYFALARELLRTGNAREFDLLIDLVKEDPAFSNDNMEWLLEMRKRLG